jgi:hypothetical protein
MNNPIQIASVPNRTGGVDKSHSLDWGKLSARLARCDIGAKDGGGWMPANIEPGQRTAERVKSVSLLVLDVEANAENVKDESGKPLLDANGDHIKQVVGPEPPDFDAMQAEVGLWGWRCILHTTYSHLNPETLPLEIEHPRYRLVFDLDRPLTPVEVKPIGLHVAALLGISDCTDTGAIEPARLFYLPRCPADRKDLFRHAGTNGDPLPVDNLLAEAAKIDQAKKSATATRRTGQSGNVIQAFNDASDVGLILEQHGYKQRGRRRWIWPGSTTGLPGVRLLPDSTPERVYSSHGGDPLNDGHAHDAFDCWRILRHGGDVKAAVKDAAQMLGMEGLRKAVANATASAKAAIQPDAEIPPAVDSGRVVITGAGSPNDPDAEVVKRLAALSPLEYDRQRKDIAESMGVRPGTLDKMVIAERKGDADDGMGFGDVEPWESPIDPAALLSEISGVVRRFIICQHETADAVALWVAMTWFMDVVQIAPLAVITAPEKRCGKSQLLFLLGKLSYRPLTASNISPAALFRAVDAWKPTLLVDEADSFMRENEELRGIINAGHTRDSAYVVRTVGEDFKPQKFSVWGAKALAGIGHLADTLMDRAIVLELRRKLPHENADRLRHAGVDLFDTLSEKLARFADDHRDSVRQARPELPASLNDRAQDNWEPLLAIADIAGGVWPDLGRKAALKLSGTDAPTMSTGTELLVDIQEVFETTKVDRISTAQLIEALCSEDERPWATYNRGKPISPRQVSKKLKDYGISSTTIRGGLDVYKGFKRDMFEEAFSRYLVSTLLPSATPLQTSPSAVLRVTDDPQRYGNKTLAVTPKPLARQDCYAVTDTTGVSGEIIEVEA